MKHPISGTIEWLADVYQLQHKDGSVNCSAFGRYVNLPATTIMRLLKADHSWTPRNNTVRRISAAFGVTEGQILGFDKIGEVGQTHERKRRNEIDEAALSDFERLFVIRLRMLVFEDQVDVMHFLEFKGQAAKAAEP